MDHPSATFRPEVLLAHREWVERTARALVHGDAEAEDVVQQVWLEVLQRPPTSEPERPRGWLRSVLRFTALDRMRSERRRRRHETGAARPETVDASPPDIVARAETVDRVVHLVLELEEPFRTTVLLRYFEDLTPAAIAARQGIPVETVRSRLKRAVARLRERLDAGNGGDRRRWCLALLPILRRPTSGTAAAAGTAASAAAGVLLMGSKTKIVVAAIAVFLIGVGGSLLLGPRGGGRDQVRLHPQATGVPTRELVAQSTDAPPLAPEIAPPTAASPKASLPTEQPTVPFEVNVLHSDGTPAKGATVVLIDTGWYPPAGNLADAPHATTDGAGMAMLACPFESGHAFAWLGDEAGVGLMGRTANAKSGRAVQDTIRMERAAVVRGRTVETSGRPIPGALVRASLTVQGPAKSWVFAMLTGEDGCFEFPPMPVSRPGGGRTVDLHASKEGFHPSQRTFESGSPASDIVTLELYRGGVLTGRLLLADGTPAAGRKIVLDATVQAQVTSGADGLFALPLSAEERDVVVLPGGFLYQSNSAIPDLRPGVGGFSSSKLLGRFRGDGGNRDLGDITLGATPGPRVLVVDPEGKPLANASVRALLGIHTVASERTDSAGTVTLPPLGPEEHVLDAEEAWLDNGWQSRKGHATVQGGAAEVRIEVAGRSGIVARVVDAATRLPLTARLETAFARVRATRTVAFGMAGGGWGYRSMVRIEVEAGTYDFEVTAVGYEPETIEGVVVTEDRDTDIEVALRKKPL